MVSVIVLAHNELNGVKLALESIRNCYGELNGLVIVIDNASTDGLLEWIQSQTDISYLCFNEGIVPWGKAISFAIREFDIDSDLIIMQARCAILPGIVSRLHSHLYSEDDIGIVTSEKTSYLNGDKLFKYLEYIKNRENHRIMAPDSRFFMIKQEFLNKMILCEEVYSLGVMVRDIAMQLYELNTKAYLCLSTLVYEIPSKFSEEESFLDYVDSDIRVLEKKWATHYFNMFPNIALVDMINRDEEDSFTVLEIGCDCGSTLLEIKNRFPFSKVCGCDISRKAVQFASFFVDECYCMDIEKDDLPFAEDSFDYIVFGDVLEHLHQPDKVLLYSNRLLRKDGRIIASIPNLMHISVIKQLLSGDFTYTKMGLLDKTHIHFFTYNEIVKMFRECGYEIEEVYSYQREKEKEDDEIIDILLGLSDKTERFMYETFQYRITAKKIVDQE